MLDSVPVGWTSDTLGNLSTVAGEYGANASKEPFDPLLPRYVRITDISEEGYLHAETAVSISREKSAGYYLQDGDIVIARSGATVGKSYVHKAENGECVFAGYLIRFRLRDDKAIPGWAKFVLQSKQYWDWVKGNQRAGAQPNINAKEYASYKVSVPPLAEQERIAGILTSVDDSISATEAVIAQAERVKRGLMEDLLTGGLGSEAIARGEVPEGWKPAQLKEITSKIGSGVTPKGGKKAYVNEGTPLIRSQNVGWGKLMLEDVAYIEREQHEKMGNSKLQTGDVLLNITGASIGRSAIYFGDDFEANVNQHVCIIRPLEAVDPKFLNAFLLSHVGQRQVDEFQAGGNREGLNFKQIGSFRIALPPAREQEKIKSVLFSIDEEIEKNQAVRSQLRRLKRGLMDDLLTGRVRTV